MYFISYASTESNIPHFLVSMISLSVVLYVRRGNKKSYICQITVQFIEV